MSWWAVKLLSINILTVYVPCVDSRSLPWFWGVANSMLFRPVQKDMGLDRCRICVSGAAPIMKETLEFFYSFDISVLEVYGMSESTGEFYFLDYYTIAE